MLFGEIDKVGEVWVIGGFWLVVLVFAFVFGVGGKVEAGVGRCLCVIMNEESVRGGSVVSDIIEGRRML